MTMIASIVLGVLFTSRAMSHALRESSTNSFMLVSGVTAKREMCAAAKVGKSKMFYLRFKVGGMFD
jgi:hypothetical protein